MGCTIRPVNSRFKIIAVTGVATTFFWAAVIAIVFWIGGKRDDRIKAQFLTDTASFGVFDCTNTETQAVTLVMEELPTDTSTTGRVELFRREIAPGQRFRVGYREARGKSQ